MDIHEKKEKNHFLIFRIFHQKVMYRKYPKFCNAFINRDKMYNDTLNKRNKLEDEGRILVIKPTRLVKISRVEKDPNIMQEQYELGINDTKDRLKDIYNNNYDFKNYW